MSKWYVDLLLELRLTFRNRFSPPCSTRSISHKASKLRKRKQRENVALPPLPENVLRQIIVLALLSFNIADETLFSDGLNETEYPAYDRLCKTFMLVSKFFSVSSSLHCCDCPFFADAFVLRNLVHYSQSLYTQHRY